MRKSKFSETKIAGILKELEAGLAVAQLVRKQGVSANAIYQWRANWMQSGRR
jgi:putative transposase